MGLANQLKTIEYIRSFEADSFLSIKDIGVDSISVSTSDQSMIPIIDCYCETMFGINIVADELTNETN